MSQPPSNKPFIPGISPNRDTSFAPDSWPPSLEGTTPAERNFWVSKVERCEKLSILGHQFLLFYLSRYEPEPLRPAGPTRSRVLTIVCADRHAQKGIFRIVRIVSAAISSAVAAGDRIIIPSQHNSIHAVPASPTYTTAADSNYKVIETLNIPDEEIMVAELAELILFMSLKHPQYQLLRRNCKFFARFLFAVLDYKVKGPDAAATQPDRRFGKARIAEFLAKFQPTWTKQEAHLHFLSGKDQELAIIHRRLGQVDHDMCELRNDMCELRNDMHRDMRELTRHMRELNRDMCDMRAAAELRSDTCILA